MGRGLTTEGEFAIGGGYLGFHYPTAHRLHPLVTGFACVPHVKGNGERGTGNGFRFWLSDLEERAVVANRLDSDSLLLDDRTSGA